jgi:glutamate racemase
VREQDRPIGVFDSGVGGLTVLAALAARLPAEDLVYLGDTARVPYGTRSADTVVRYASQVAGRLHRERVKALVIACNTATTWALPALQAAGARHGVPVVGVIAPGVERALALSAGGRIGVIGTEGTIRGDRYGSLLRAGRPGVEVRGQACPLFVALAEEGWTSGPVARLVAEEYLGGLRGRIDTLILGCTHYPLLEPVIADALPGVAIVDSATATADAVAALLGAHGLVRSGPGGGARRFLVTDHLERFAAVGARFLQEPPAPVELIDLDLDEGAAWRPAAGAAG